MNNLQKLRGRKALLFDTETTGFPRDGEVLAKQPHLVQLAWALVQLPEVGGELRTIASSSAMLRLPEGVAMGAGAEKVHGISAERLQREGLGAKEVVGMFFDVAELADVVVGHNVQFDKRIMAIAAQRLREGGVPALTVVGSKKVLHGPYLCTQELAKPVCNLPATEKMKRVGRRGPKVPKLIEAHEHLLGCGFDGAHDAMVDVQATVRVLLALLDRADGEVGQ